MRVRPHEQQVEEEEEGEDWEEKGGEDSGVGGCEGVLVVSKQGEGAV